VLSYNLRRAACALLKSCTTLLEKAPQACEKGIMAPLVHSVVSAVSKVEWSVDDLRSLTSCDSAPERGATPAVATRAVCGGLTTLP